MPTPTVAVPYRRNFASVVGQSITYGIAIQLASAAVVYPFLCVAFGGSILVASFIFPVFTAASFVGMLLARKLDRFIRSPALLGILGLANAVLVAAAAVLSGFGDPGLAQFLLWIALIQGLASGVASVVYVNVAAAALGPHHKPQLPVIQGVGSGLLVIAATIAVSILFGGVAGPIGQVILLWIAAAGLAGSAIFCLFVHIPEHHVAVPARHQHVWSEIKESLRAPWLRRWLFLQTLFMPIALAVGFYSSHGATLHAEAGDALHQLVGFGAFGSLLFGLLWFPLRKRLNVRHVYLLAAALAFIAALCCVAVDYFIHDDDVQPWVHGAMITVAAAAALATTSVRQSWLLGQLTASSSTTSMICQVYLSMISVIFGGVLSFLGHVDTIWPIYVMAAIAIAAACGSLLAPNVAPHTISQPER